MLVTILATIGPHHTAKCHEGNGLPMASSSSLTQRRMQGVGSSEDKQGVKHRKHGALLLCSAVKASETSAALDSSLSSVIVHKADFGEVVIETVPPPPLSAQETRKIPRSSSA